MIIDANAYLGHWPLAKVPHTRGRDFVRLMDRKGIDKAVVASASAIFYRNAQHGNLELAEEIRGFEDRLIPFATINPAYAGWQDDMAFCLDKLGMKGLRLQPCYHGYALDDDNVAELAATAARRGAPVSVNVGMEDQRQRHWLIKLPQVEDGTALNNQVIKAIQRTPDATFLLLQVGYLGFATFNYQRIIEETRAPVGKLYFGTSQVLLTPLAAKLAEVAPLMAPRFIFTAQMPFKYVDPALLLLDSLPLSSDEREAVSSGNLLRALGMA